MAMYHNDQSPFLTSLQDGLNLLFTYIFIGELALKMYALYPKRYFEESWNRFDFVIVLGSLPGLFGVDAGSGATIFRIFRIGRMFKLVQSARGLRALFNTFILSIPAIGNVGSLLFLLMFVYDVLGMNLFGGSPYKQHYNEVVNFDNFGNGLLLLFRVFTGDSWSNILMDSMDCGQMNGYVEECSFSLVTPVYYITFMLFGSFVMLNLIIAVILDKFVDAATNEGLLSTNTFFDALQRKMLLDSFIKKLRKKVALARAGLDEGEEEQLGRR